MNFQRLFTLTHEASQAANRYRQEIELGSLRNAMRELDTITLAAREISQLNGELSQTIVDRFIAGDSAELG